MRMCVSINRLIFVIDCTVDIAVSPNHNDMNGPWTQHGAGRSLAPNNN
jgi:hypothetical protein